MSFVNPTPDSELDAERAERRKAELRTSKQDLVAKLEAAAKWVLEKNTYTLGSLRDARAAVLDRLPDETGACAHCKTLDGSVVDLCDLIGAEYIPDRIYRRVESRNAVKANECPRCPERQGATCNYCGREYL